VKPEIAVPEPRRPAMRSLEVSAAPEIGETARREPSNGAAQASQDVILSIRTAWRIDRETGN